ncbi:MAG: ankyrin repeat domain-containing protein, partial [Akkermansia sp.]|nr:ankyrin repeat domain-containing protein [Akkermansia sp.]
TLLHRRSSEREMVAALLKHGADINAQDEDGDTVLHDAVIANEPEIVQMLLEAGADVSIRNEEGQTPEDIALEIPIGRVLRVFREFRK